jgi:hypothetical protein
MSISTVQRTEEKKERERLMKLFHKPTFDALGLSEKDYEFIPKLAYKPKEIEATEPHIGLFASEISKGKDIYIEFADRDGIPQDAERRLYKWRFNPNFREEYVCIDNTTSIRYFIPTSELVLIKTNSPEVLVEQSEKPKKAVDLFTLSSDDVSLNDATIRDLAAVLWKQPVSNKEWLNDLIKINKI